MSDMIETVAKAMWHAIAPLNPWETALDEDYYDGPGRDNTRKMARAAIEAMREPTKEMSEKLEYALLLWAQDKGTNEDVYYAAIDAALSQDTPSLPLKPQEAVKPAGSSTPPSTPAGTNSEAQP